MVHLSITKLLLLEPNFAGATDRWLVLHLGSQARVGRRWGGEKGKHAHVCSAIFFLLL